MARIRTIKPEFPQSESIGSLSRDARLLFIQLWTLVDDDGRARAASRMLASLLYPYDDDAPQLIDGWLDDLEAEGMIRRYSVDGSSYLDIPHWDKHQKIDHKSKSRLPAYSAEISSLANPREESRTLAPDLGPRTVDQDHGPSLLVACATLENVAIAPVVFEKFWEAYPKRDGPNPKEPARKKFVAIVKSGVDPDYLISGAKRYADEARAKGQLETPYIAQVKTWLEQQRWRDYAPKADDPEKRAREDAIFAKNGMVWDETLGRVVPIIGARA